ncbi:hypothetical protein [Legionella gresilensis]|uniref:hypothetical protein n=1 Tax=Legionella gresilensis TaxID=91823 RepID=UPI001040E345|nr:hypothetical protein [Legionella gresilensis]
MKSNTIKSYSKRGAMIGAAAGAFMTHHRISAAIAWYGIHAKDEGLSLMIFNGILKFIIPAAAIGSVVGGGIGFFADNQSKSSQFAESNYSAGFPSINI